MSKIPIDRNGKLRIRGIYSMKSIDVINPSKDKQTDAADKAKNIDAATTADNKELFCSNYLNLVPKMSLSLDKGLEKNPRILDLREKLNEITKKQDRNVDKQTKGLINGITQLVDEKEQDESGPYSLLFDLQPSTCKESFDKELLLTQSLKNSTASINKSADRLPNVINFDDKPMREFEYSCENRMTYPVTKTFNTHSRSDLCLQLKSQVNPRIYDTNLSPNDNSLNRTNEENSLDDSLGILTPDQMDDICYLENAFSPTVEGLPIFCDNNESKVSPDCSDTPSTDKTDSNSAVSTIQNDEFERNDRTAPLSRNIESLTPEKLSKSCDNLSAQTPSSLTTKTENSTTSMVKENKTELRDIPKDELIPNVVDDEFMPSIHSSILEPVSSIAETTVNLELPLDCKLENRLIVQRIEQTPSPEDLPLDNSDIHGEISYNSQFSNSTLHDSQTYSDNKNDYQKSMETSKVSNSFITSITSITSLDGYQGDGEMSRPVSRTADHSIEPREDVIEMEWQNVPVTRRPDPMTDSDFFTESDADGLDDHMHRGDRKAQVIDGALYGGKNSNGNPPLMVNRNDDSCMESSGVYTDFENHRQSPVFLNVIDDMSPEGSTPSTHSELSQKNINSGQANTYCSPEEGMTEDSFKNQAAVEEDKSPKNTSKRNSLNSEKDVRSNAKSKDEKRSFTLKKYKMPKRDVPSKLKTMLANRNTDADNSVQSSPKTVKKIDRRESLTKKNSLDIKTDYKMKSFKDIKSKVDCSFSLQRSQTACSVSRMLSSKSTNTNIKPKSRHMRMRMELGSAAGSGKSSLHSSQSDLSASTPLKHPPSRFPLLRNGKKRDSVAAPTPPPVRPPPTPPQPPAQVKKNGVVPKLSSSPVAVRARTSLAPPPSPRKPAARRTPAQRPNTLPTNNKEPPRVTAAVGPRSKRAPTPARATPALAPRETQAAALAHAAKGVEALGVLVQYLVFRLDALNGGSWRLEAERWRGVAAAERTSAERADHDRQQRAQKDLDTIAECLGKISELEMEVSSKEEANARLQAAHVNEVTALANDIKGLKETIDSLKREVAESRARLHAHSEIERTLRAQLEAARAEIERADSLRAAADSARAVSSTACNTVCDRADAACDPVCCEVEECQLRLSANEELSTDANELAAEVRSLRAVIELKQAEMASLRDARTELSAERERRAAAEREARAARHAAEELKERAAARQREADRLRDDNRRLRDAAARDRDQASRIAALNEELRYKLRQKSQVVSLLAGGGYMERVRARTSSGSSLRSASPESPPSPASPAPDAPALPAVKGVVEKHDSVSWVLEIEETPEEVASRLARRSSFRTTGSPLSSSGVKRRGGGGGSPGAGSPAPASPAPAASKLFRADLDFPPPPPPLKESAGEAIYIYDDASY
ncbi:microtubule-associated protein futsch isoform X1 [Leguminivora glycinivorella]|uniref:microtubule-associated protein futsch isoform X1 n=1 Tax=Leguminivora glycinivorella TaxID=1035111 RepID=UPI00200E7031|nr:microtubule-associated protein futsch isoform X1 [Leguminivora glycinivorella]